MYKKSALKKIGSIVVVAALIASAFTMMSVENVSGDSHNSATIKINEIMYDPATGDEWVELYNPGDSDVNVSEWHLNDSADNTFGDLTNVEIAAGGYSVVTDAAAILNNDDGDTITLYNGSTIVDTVAYDDDAETNYTLARTYEGNWMQSLEQGGTPGEQNGVWDTVPPEIANVKATPETQKTGGTINITCNVTDNVGVDTVKVHITGPEGFEEVNTTMEKGSYHYSQTYSILGPYNYTIWATDTSGNTHTSAEYSFDVITNLEVTPGNGYYGDTLDITVHNATASNLVKLYKPGSTTSITEKIAKSDGTATFKDVDIDMAGDWMVKDAESGNETTFTAMAANLTVTVDPAEQKYSQGGVYEFNATVENEDGNAVDGADVTVYYIDENGDNAKAVASVNEGDNGSYAIEATTLKGIGIYNVTATKNTTGTTKAEWEGYGHAKITPNDLTFDDVTDKEAHAGFPSAKKFLVKYADTNQSIDWTKPINVTLTHKGESNSTGDVDLSTGNATVVIGGETASIDNQNGNLTINMQWPETGEYDLTVKQDYAGSTMVDNESYEYTGSTTFDVATPPDVNIDMRPDTVDVNDTGNNTVTLKVEVLGDGIDVYGSPKNLSIGAAPDYENITKRFTIEGDILYTPSAGAYEYKGDGIWHVEVFPTTGNGMIYVNVTWPNNGTDGDTVTIDEGGHMTVDPATVVVDNNYNFSVTLKTKDGDTYPRAEYLRLYLENKSYYKTGGWELVQEKTSVYNANGEFTFSNVSIDKAAVNYMVAAYFETDTDQYAFARIKSNPAHDLEVDWSPGEVMAGASTEHTINITKDNESYDNTFQLYLLNETQYDDLQNEELDLETMTPIEKSAADFTIPKTIVEPGTYYLYVRTKDKKHDNMGTEPSIDVTKATVTPDMDMVVKHIDTNATVTFDVTWNGDNPDGILTINGINNTGEYNKTYMEGEKTTVDVTNGTATIHNLKVINGSQAGYEITFTFEPEDGKDADAEGTMTVTIPDITVEPETISLGEQNIITVTVTNPRNDNPVADMQVTGDFPAGNMTLGETDANGQITAGIIPDMTGTITLYVEGDQAGSITIDVGSLDIHVIEDNSFLYGTPKMKKGTEYTIKVTTKGGKEIQGATVEVAGNTYTTNADGEVTWKPDTKGDFTITATYGTYDQGTQDVTVKKKPSTPGFGLGVLMLGMLGAALILWRRRR